ncbi:MAG TPA: hypothetical protein VGN26_03855 [Armatimonadota bacterium]|jgi:hypothetical protein
MVPTDGAVNGKAREDAAVARTLAGSLGDAIGRIETRQEHQGGQLQSVCITVAGMSARMDGMSSRIDQLQAAQAEARRPNPWVERVSGAVLTLLVGIAIYLFQVGGNHVLGK